MDAYNIEFLDIGHSPKNILAFSWKGLDFEVEVDNNGVILKRTLKCLTDCVEKVDFPPRHGVWRDLRNCIDASFG
jgi:hypothetical protein